MRCWLIDSISLLLGKKFFSPASLGLESQAADFWTSLSHREGQEHGGFKNGLDKFRSLNSINSNEKLGKYKLAIWVVYLLESLMGSPIQLNFIHKRSQANGAWILKYSF